MDKTSRVTRGSPFHFRYFLSGFHFRRSSGHSEKEREQGQKLEVDGSRSSRRKSREHKYEQVCQLQIASGQDQEDDKLDRVALLISHPLRGN